MRQLARYGKALSGAVGVGITAYAAVADLPAWALGIGAVGTALAVYFVPYTGDQTDPED